MEGGTGKDLPAILDEMKADGSKGVILLATEANGKAAVAVGVGSDVSDTVSAVDVLKAAVGALGGKGGGGRADLAQGGAPSLDNWDGATQAAIAVIQTAVGRA